MSSSISLVSVISLAWTTGCMALTPQLPPTDFAALEQLERRADRDRAYVENTIRVSEEPQGRRYSKGTDSADQKRSWQSLDAVLRSDEYASEALPYRPLRWARLFTALTIAASIVTVAGAAGSAREGLSLQHLDGPSSLLLFGGIATVGFGITAGIFHGRARRGYESAVSVYNQSLGMRLGVLDSGGEYIPAPGVLVDGEGFILVDEVVPDSSAPRGNQSEPGDVPPSNPLRAPDPSAPLEPSERSTTHRGQVLNLTALRTAP